MTPATRLRLPAHLLKYVVKQDYQRYTPEDQAVWRYIMRQLKNFLSQHAHKSYLLGLQKTGLEVDRIPRIEVIDAHLERFGWGAVPVSGFIPPAAFMEFQSIGILPIASDMRTIGHLLYTPAPDIVHEAAGHAPLLADPEYASYLRQYGEVARHSIISKEDMAQYEAIRILSDLKEDPRSTADEIKRAEQRVNDVTMGMKHVSEAALLSRMNWWTAEYGLIGDLKDPKIFGAGLLSSVGESRAYLDSKVKKIPLSVDCVNFSYDITEPQPQLFIARDFGHLGLVLEDLTTRLAYRRGGVFGLERAIEAETVNTVQLNSGIQISGLVQSFLTDADHAPIYLQFVGPSQLSYANSELSGQGTKRHAQGFSCPVGLLKNHRHCLSAYTTADLVTMALRKDERTRLEFESGVQVEGVLKDILFSEGKPILLTWQDCTVTLGDRRLFEPAWGEYDMAVGSQVISVFGGPADRSHYGQTDDFVAQQIPARTYTAPELERHNFFQSLRTLRESGSHAEDKFHELLHHYLKAPERDWLQGVELLELSHALKLSDKVRAPLLSCLNAQKYLEYVKDGVALAALQL